MPLDLTTGRSPTSTSKVNEWEWLRIDINDGLAADQLWNVTYLCRHRETRNRHPRRVDKFVEVAVQSISLTYPFA